MPNNILHKRSATAGVVPHAALLANGELALNTVDGTWFLKRTDGTVLDLRQPLITDGGAQPLDGINADAQDWQTRVIAAGGTVSATTFTAVNNFCNSIDAAGIRDRFYRLNLFCGGNLNAALVPLYRGPSIASVQGGRTIDSNNGPFLAGDYVETAGLTGNGSSKHLRIGTLNSVYQGVPATGHMAAWVGANPDINKRTMGIFDLILQSGQPYVLNYQLSRSTGDQSFGRAGILVPATSQAAVFQVINRTSTTNVVYYENATSVGTASLESINRDIPDADISVFGASYYNWNNNTFSHGYEAPASTYSSYSCGRSLTGTQVTAYYNALLAFRVAMGRTAPLVPNADAQDWIARAHTAGGTVSQSTATAVNTFCNTIDSAGLRDRFYRLNLFCGNNLTACLVPLYRGQTRTGTQFGNSTDTNIAFTSGDYAETGASGGLQGNGTSKYLLTGFPGNTLSTGNRHLSVYEMARDTGAYRTFLGTQDDNLGTYYFSLGNFTPGTSVFASVGTLAASSGHTTNGHWIANDSSNPLSLNLYKNAMSVASSNSTARQTPSSNQVAVFGTQNNPGNNNVVAGLYAGRFAAYSIGLSMTAQQITNYYTALQTFQAALSRVPVVANADAQDWINRVYAAGGTVSPSTADAINTFCNSINSTGLRDRFYRLNLFCGNDLTACRVPLYRGQSLSGTQFGNTTDTNFNFVSTDYVERGTTGGLTGNGNLGVQAGTATKHLRTGLQQASIGTSLMHLSTFVFGLNTAATQQQGFVGIRDNFTPVNRWWLEYRGAVNTELGGPGVGFGMNAAATGNFLITASRESNTLLRSYFNGLRYGTDATADVSATLKTSTRDFFVAAANIDGDAVEFCNFRLGMYSIGLTLTETQAGVFNSVVAAFNTALNRS